MLTGAAAVGAAGVIGFEGQATAKVTRAPVELTWFGTHAWQVRCGENVVLTDPWLTRFKTGTFTP
jgi:hypothetical protein